MFRCTKTAMKTWKSACVLRTFHVKFIPHDSTWKPFKFQVHIYLFRFFTYTKIQKIYALSLNTWGPRSMSWTRENSDRFRFIYLFSKAGWVYLYITVTSEGTWHGLTHDHQGEFACVHPWRLLHLALVDSTVAARHRGDRQGGVAIGRVSRRKVQALHQVRVAMDVLPPTSVGNDLRDRERERELKRWKSFCFTSNVW